MYIKESPEYFKDKSYNSDNLNNFIKTMQYVEGKYRVLKPFWIQIQKIMTDTSFLAIDNEIKKNRERIEERLKMFWGLLKKGYEQSSYDKTTFFYSDYELAFMTLWSVFNEIQEASYDKNDFIPIETLLDAKENIVSCQKDGRKIVPLKGFNWKIKDQSDVFIKHEFGFRDFDLVSGEPISFVTRNGTENYELESKSIIAYLEFDPKHAPFYKNGISSRSALTRELHSQIAFLILNKNNLKNSPNRNDYLIRLKS